MYVGSYVDDYTKFKFKIQTGISIGKTIKTCDEIKKGKKIKKVVDIYK